MCDQLKWPEPMEKPGEIDKLIPKIMKAVGPIAKSRKNAQQNYNFRGIDDVYNALQLILADNGVFIVPRILDRTTREVTTQKGGTLNFTAVDVAFQFRAADGSFFYAVTSGDAMDSGDKSALKAQSAAMKYACLQVFSIPTADPKDPENDSPEAGAGKKNGKPVQPDQHQTPPTATGNDEQPPDNSGVSDGELLKNERFRALMIKAADGNEVKASVADVLGRACAAYRVEKLSDIKEASRRRNVWMEVANGVYDQEKK